MGDEIQATVRIVPNAKYPFAIVGSRALEGKDIRFTLVQDKSGGQAGYVLTVANLKAEPGNYRDTIELDTDSPVKPRIRIKVNGTIQRMQIAEITPPGIVFRGRSGQIQGVSARIVPKPGYDFKITGTAADKGENIRFSFTEAREDGTLVYTLAVENQKKVRGSYRDTIRLKTTSEVQPEIEIPVVGFIR